MIWREEGREDYQQSLGIYAGAVAQAAARVFQELEANGEFRLARKQVASDLIRRGDEERNAVCLVRNERRELREWVGKSGDL